MLRPEHSHRFGLIGRSLLIDRSAAPSRRGCSSTWWMRLTASVTWWVRACAVMVCCWVAVPACSDDSLATFLRAAVQSLPAVHPDSNLPATDSRELPLAIPIASSSAGNATDAAPMEWAWWSSRTGDFLLDSPNWLRFDLPTLLTDAIESSPRVSAVSRRTSIAYEKIVQQDAVFDPAMLLESGLGRVNDPVGNTLTTGGPPRLIQDNLIAQGGVRRLTRGGAEVDLTQELGTLTSNSVFFDPLRQGNSRLSLSITQPLMATGGVAYNTRLITQASIDSRIAWSELRRDIESHLGDTLDSFWHLYERRCHLIQQRALIERGERIGDLVRARSGLDAGPLQLIKVQRRLSERQDRALELDAEIRRLQIRLRALIGGDPRAGAIGDSEMIPVGDPILPHDPIMIRDAIVRGLEHRPDIRAATEQLAAAALSVSVTRNELKPRLDAVFDAYLAGLNGQNDFFRSFGDQFSEGGPGLTATLQYNMPIGQRAAKSRHREARYRFQQRSDELQQTMWDARAEIESALVRVETSVQLRDRREVTLIAAAREESIATRRYEVLAGDGGQAALVLEDLLETQTRRTLAEQAYVTAAINHVLSLVDLQRAMGTLLINESVEVLRPGSTSEVIVTREGPDTWPDDGLIEDTGLDFSSQQDR